MKRLIGTGVAAALALAACGGGSDGDEATPSANQATTTSTVASTVVEVVVVTVAEPVEEMSREARLAVNDCVDVVDFPSFVVGDLRGGVDDELTEARDLCAEAGRQLEVEDAPEAVDLRLAVASLNLQLGVLQLDFMTGTIEESSVEAYNAAVDDLLEAVS